MTRGPFLVSAMLLSALAFSTRVGEADSSRVMYSIPPNVADRSITRFLSDNVVIYRRTAASTAPLLVFMPGTNGRPKNLLRFLDAAATVGYRAIGLTYDDAPAVNVVCPHDPDPLCNEHFRAKRIYGDNVTSVIDDAPEESIVNRLTKLLEYLASQYPLDGWGGYLAGGALNWSRIAVGGHSQGAGMAAFIAKDHAVYRVVLFSSPWDFHAPNQQLASWLTKPSATPLDRWYAAYHAREPMATVIARAYAALGIPQTQIRVLNLEPNRQGNAAHMGPMIYHTSVVGDFTTPIASDGTPAYLSDWLFMLGSPPT